MTEIGRKEDELKAGSSQAAEKDRVGSLEVNDGKHVEMLPSIDTDRIQRAVREILLAIGENPDRAGLVRTPERVAAAYTELFAGLHDEPRNHLAVTFEEEHRELVVLRDIPFASVCEHHLLPFTGHVHIGYVPQGRVVGLSKLARLVEGYARRPQVQERLTSELADALMSELQPDGCGVVIEATHTCMTIRGVQKPGTSMITSAIRGSFQRRPETRAEFFAVVRHRRGGA